MAQKETTFSDRLQRIDENRRGYVFARRREREETQSIVVHPDGFVQSITVPSRRLRFTFPIKGVLFACVLAILVKAYLIWTLGDDVYGAAVAQLLAGNDLERAAGLILAPDAVSNWMVDAYQQIYRYILSVATALEIGTFPQLAEG